MINFLPINPDEVKAGFPEFYDSDKDFYEIIQQDIPIGFYGIKRINSLVCEISVYIHEEHRNKICKITAFSCLRFPFTLGFVRIFISTRLDKMCRFLKRMSKHGVKYVDKCTNFYWFEVNNEFR